MKKFLFMLALITASFSSTKANDYAFGQALYLDVPTSRLFIGWFDMNTGYVYRIEWYDTTTDDYSNYWRFKSLDYTHNAGAVKRLVVTDSFGKLLVSPVDSLPPRNFGITSIASGARSFGTAYQVDANNASTISISVKAVTTLTLTGGQSGDVFLEWSSSSSGPWNFGSQLPAGNTGSLTIGLNTVQTTGGQLTQDLPGGYWWKVRSSGTGTYTFLGGYEKK